ncbi:MAG: phenylacetate--CoA ligase family protein [Planctomycetes bacterium]|nr:phenylacetate--CoA ligase family protein [Planctomycetota bacterium]
MTAAVPSPPPLKSGLGRGLDLARAAALRWGRLRRAERGSRAELLALQEQRLEALIEHAWSHSPYYRRSWGGRMPRAEDFPKLEPLDKAELVERYDDVLADRALSRGELQRRLGQPGRGPHVVLATSGTTGEPVVIPYSRREWIEGLAYALRGESRRSAGLLPSLWSARRLATVLTQNPIHASTHLHSGFSIPPLRRLQLSAGEPIEEQIEKLERFQPAMLAGYPSAIDPLARAQLEGRLAIRPRRVLTGGETLAEGLRERVRAAWGAEVFDCYGLTETLVIAWECREHRGLHIDEDAAIIEVVDDRGRVLPAGEKGSAILVTNLFNFTLPIIRYRVGDMLRIATEPCPCGVPFARLVSLEGRREEELRLRGRSGETASIHPTALEAPIEALPWVRRFQIRAEDGGLRLLAEVKDKVEEPAEKLREALRPILEKHAALPEALRVEIVERIDEERGRTGKRRRVIRQEPSAG